MANKSINALDNTSTLASADLLVLWKASANAAYNISGQDFTTMLTELAEGHGGIDTIDKTSSSGTDPVVDTYTITYADDSTSTFEVTNGEKGDTGAQTFVYVRYADAEPTQDSEVGVIPSPWMGIYVGLEDDPTNLHYTDYEWYRIKGTTGETGAGVGNIEKTQSSGLTDTYTMYSNESPPQSLGIFTVTNGSGGVSLVNNTSQDGNGNVVVNLYLSGSIASFPKIFSDARITQNMILTWINAADPNVITSDIGWTTTDGSLTLTGSINSGATTIEVILSAVES